MIIKCFLHIILLVTFFDCLSQNNSESAKKKAINIDDFVSYFTCPTPGSFLASDVVKIKFFFSEENKVKLIEVTSTNTALKSHCENIFNSLPSKAFSPFHQVNDDTLTVPIKFSPCITEENINDKKIKRK